MAPRNRFRMVVIAGSIAILSLVLAKYYVTPRLRKEWRTSGVHRIHTNLEETVDPKKLQEWALKKIAEDDGTERFDWGDVPGKMEGIIFARIESDAGSKFVAIYFSEHLGIFGVAVGPPGWAPSQNLFGYIELWAPGIYSFAQ